MRSERTLPSTLQQIKGSVHKFLFNSETDVSENQVNYIFLHLFYYTLPSDGFQTKPLYLDLYFQNFTKISVIVSL